MDDMFKDSLRDFDELMKSGDELIANRKNRIALEDYTTEELLEEVDRRIRPGNPFWSTLDLKTLLGDEDERRTN